ncbi:MAG: hypothetical protein AAF982_12720 [Pseudomonadota bacterium]
MKRPRQMFLVKLIEGIDRQGLNGRGGGSSPSRVAGFDWQVRTPNETAAGASVQVHSGPTHLGRAGA